MLNAGALARITVLSVVLVLDEPPPDTAALFTRGVPAVAATFTVTVIAGYPAPPSRASLRVQTLEEHVQPVPVIDTSVIPVGTVSVTTTVPLVGALPGAFDTVTVYVAPVW